MSTAARSCESYHGYPICCCFHFANRANSLRHVSFVDCPGHDILMATMLTGAAVSTYRPFSHDCWPAVLTRQ